MLATVVIPCLNCEATIGLTLKALLQQTVRSEFQIVVVDNGSTDRSVAVARPLADRVLLETTPGSAAARNAGLRATVTGLYLSLDADVIPGDCRWAARHVEAMQRAPSMAIGTAGRLLPVPTSDWWAQRPEMTPHPAFAGSEPLYAVGGNACYRTEQLRLLGGFPSFAADDAALGRNARVQGLHFIWLPDAVVLHHNPVGPGNYYRQMRKIGRYVGEMEGGRDKMLAFGCRQAARLAKNLRHFVLGHPRIGAAEVLHTVGFTHGYLGGVRLRGSPPTS